MRIVRRSNVSEATESYFLKTSLSSVGARVRLAGEICLEVRIQRLSIFDPELIKCGVVVLSGFTVS